MAEQLLEKIGIYTHDDLLGDRKKPTVDFSAVMSVPLFQRQQYDIISMSLSYDT